MGFIKTGKGKITHTIEEVGTAERDMIGTGGQFIKKGEKIVIEKEIPKKEENKNGDAKPS